MTLSELTTFTPQGINIPEGITQEDWAQIHKTILTCKHAAAKWLKQSRDYGTAQWGVEFVADTEVQLELGLGIEFKDTPNVNARDKSPRIVNIEGVAQSFSLWDRKMADEIPTWDKDQLTRAIDLLEPIEARVRAMREIREGKV